VPADAALTDLLAPLRAVPARAGVLTDFDGTLAPTVDDPASAAPLEGVAGLLGELARRYRIVAVLSGRPVSFLAAQLPPTVVLSGLYGLEIQRDGRRDDHPAGEAWREVIDAVASAAEASGPEGMRVEPKGLSLTLHYRGRPDIAPAVLAWAEDESARSGLTVRAAKMSVELHPPIAADKGTAVRDLAGGLSAVCFLGDDVGDLPAFDELDALAESGVATVRIAVRSDEAPGELLARADLIVDGPAGAALVLEALL
jgi:trehalose 6-phosphate phosphatase